MVISTVNDDELLARSWRRSWGHVTDEQGELTRDTTIWRYSEPFRKYHGLRHLVETLRIFEVHCHLASNETLVELALWFHDAVYDTCSNLNEEYSAMLLAKELESVKEHHYSSESIIRAQEHTRTLILATKHRTINHPSNSEISLRQDADLICDIDLITLSADIETFKQHCLDIRSEYSKFPDDVYYPERLKILKGFLKRGFIYRTNEFSSRYEKAAIANLEYEVNRLQEKCISLILN